jgi:hypothetical protein
MSIQEAATEDQKKVLRRTNLVSPVTDVARNVLVSGILGGTVPGLSGEYLQFAKDVRIYGLWEALLYAENYEAEGAYAPGTALKAFQAAVKKLLKRKAR